jgi:hypothetical protein
MAQVVEHEGGEVLGLFPGAVAEVGGPLLIGGLLGQLVVMLSRQTPEDDQQTEEADGDKQEPTIESLALEEAGHAAAGGYTLRATSASGIGSLEVRVAWSQFVGAWRT